jgi:hypothetical protein
MKKLIEHYPLTFSNNSDWTYDSLECKGGWFTLLDRLFDAIEKHLETLPKKSEVRKDFVILQVKEKFGGLRVYVGGADDFIYDKILQVEEDSKSICEFCGINGELAKCGWYYRTVCRDCGASKSYTPLSDLKKESNDEHG